MALLSELIDETKYLANRNDFLKLLRLVYADHNVADIIREFNLVLVGGQALAIWHYQYFSSPLNPIDIHYSFSDDVDFYGLKVSLQFLKKQLNVEIKTPKDFDSTVNLGVFTIPSINNDAGYFIVDVIHSVGGLTDREIIDGIDIALIEDFEFPVINPVLCLKSRIHNFFSTYKPDKVRELHRVEIAVRCCKAYLSEELDSGWTKDTSRLIESIFDIAKSRNGCDLFVRHGVDVLQAIDITHPNMHSSFVDLRYNKASKQIDGLRKKRAAHLERFSQYKPSEEQGLKI